MKATQPREDYYEIEIYAIDSSAEPRKEDESKIPLYDQNAQRFLKNIVKSYDNLSNSNIVPLTDWKNNLLMYSSKQNVASFRYGEYPNVQDDLFEIIISDTSQIRRIRAMNKFLDLRDIDLEKIADWIIDHGSPELICGLFKQATIKNKTEFKSHAERLLTSKQEEVSQLQYSKGIFWLAWIYLYKIHPNSEQIKNDKKIIDEIISTCPTSKGSCAELIVNYIAKEQVQKSANDSNKAIFSKLQRYTDHTYRLLIPFLERASIIERIIFTSFWNKFMKKPGSNSLIRYHKQMIKIFDILDFPEKVPFMLAWYEYILKKQVTTSKGFLIFQIRRNQQSYKAIKKFYYWIRKINRILDQWRESKQEKIFMAKALIIGYSALRYTPSKHLKQIFKILGDDKSNRITDNRIYRERYYDRRSYFRDNYYQNLRWNPVHKKIFWNLFPCPSREWNEYPSILFSLYVFLMRYKPIEFHKVTELYKKEILARTNPFIVYVINMFYNFTYEEKVLQEMKPDKLDYLLYFLYSPYLKAKAIEKLKSWLDSDQVTFTQVINSILEQPSLFEELRTKIFSELLLNEIQSKRFSKAAEKDTIIKVLVESFEDISLKPILVHILTYMNPSAWELLTDREVSIFLDHPNPDVRLLLYLIKKRREKKLPSLKNIEMAANTEYSTIRKILIELLYKLDKEIKKNPLILAILFESTFTDIQKEVEKLYHIIQFETKEQLQLISYLLTSPNSTASQFAINQVNEIFMENISVELLIELLESPSPELATLSLTLFLDTIKNFSINNPKKFIQYAKSIIFVPNRIAKAKDEIYRILSYLGTSTADKSMKEEIKSLLLEVAKVPIQKDRERALGALIEIDYA